MKLDRQELNPFHNKKKAEKFCIIFLFQLKFYYLTKRNSWDEIEDRCYRRPGRNSKYVSDNMKIVQLNYITVINTEAEISNTTTRTGMC